MPELVHHRGRILSAGDEDRGEGVAQLVRREAVGKRNTAPSFEQFVCLSNHRREDATSDVVLVALPSGPGRKDQNFWRDGIAPFPMRLQEAAKDRL